MCHRGWGVGKWGEELSRNCCFDSHRLLLFIHISQSGWEIQNNRKWDISRDQLAEPGDSLWLSFPISGLFHVFLVGFVFSSLHAAANPWRYSHFWKIEVREDLSIPLFTTTITIATFCCRCFCFVSTCRRIKFCFFCKRSARFVFFLLSNKYSRISSLLSHWSASMWHDAPFHHKARSILVATTWPCQLAWERFDQNWYDFFTRSNSGHSTTRLTFVTEYHAFFWLARFCFHSFFLCLPPSFSFSSFLVILLCVTTRTWIHVAISSSERECCTHNTGSTISWYSRWSFYFWHAVSKVRQLSNQTEYLLWHALSSPFFFVFFLAFPFVLTRIVQFTSSGAISMAQLERC